MSSAMRRIVVVGNSGSGKTTLADELAKRLQSGRIELDALYHRPDWTPAPVEDFRADLLRALDRADIDQGGWVVCGNYSAVRDVLWHRADTVIWLDFPRTVVMSRVLRRTTARVVRRTELWNGNQEKLAQVLALHDRERSIVRWAWDGVSAYRAQYEQVWGRSELGPSRWLRFTSPRRLRVWLEMVTPEPDPRSGTA